MSVSVTEKCNSVLDSLYAMDDPTAKTAHYMLQLTNNRYSDEPEYKKNQKKLQREAIICLNTHRKICTDPIVRNQLEMQVIELLPVNRFKKLYLKSAKWLPFQYGEKSLDNTLKKLTYTIPRHNFISKNAAIAEALLVKFYASQIQKFKNNFVKDESELLDQIYAINQSLAKDYDIRKLTFQIEEPWLKGLTSNFENMKGTYYDAVYKKMDATFDYFLKHPYKMLGKSLLFGTPFRDKNLDNKMYKILKTLLSISSIDYLESIYRKYFNDGNNSNKKIEDFLAYISKALLYVDKQNLKKYGYDNNRKNVAIIKPFKHLINTFSEKHHLSSHVYLKKSGQKSGLRVGKRKPLLMARIRYRKVKSILMPLSTLFAGIVAVGQFFIGTFALKSIFSLGPSVAIGSTAAYTNTYLYKEDTKSVAKQFLLKRDFSNGLKSFFGYLATFVIGGLAITTGATMAILSCISTLGVIPGVGGIILGSLLGLVTLFVYSSMMHRTGTRMAMGLMNSASNFTLTSLKKNIRDKYEHWNENKIKNTIRFCLKGFLYSSAIILGVFSIVSTLGAWAAGVSKFLSLYLHFAPMIADIASKIVVFSFAGILKGIFNMSSIMHLVSSTSDFVIDILVFKPISLTKNAIFHPQRSIKNLGSTVKKGIFSTLIFIEEAKRNPWYTVIAGAKKIKGMFFDCTLIAINAIGAGALGYNGFGTLEAIGISRKIAPFLAFGSSFGVSAGCNSRAILAELDKEKTDMAPALYFMDAAAEKKTKFKKIFKKSLDTTGSKSQSKNASGSKNIKKGRVTKSAGGSKDLINIPGGRSHSPSQLFLGQLNDSKVHNPKKNYQLPLQPRSLLTVKI